MPPVRREASSKQFQYERSHEENQERAYIAASRRSDRSLEARVESARRASDLHKKRTGRALQVTEAAVVNEEMYEEIIDLPSRQSLLHSHYEAEHANFDRRLLAYIGTQVATRNMLGQAISSHQQADHSNDTNQSVPACMPQPALPHQLTEYRHHRQQQQYHHHKQICRPQEQQEDHQMYPPHVYSASPSPGGQSYPQRLRSSLQTGHQDGVSSDTAVENSAALHQPCHSVRDNFDNPSQVPTPTTGGSYSPCQVLRHDSAMGMTKQNISSQQSAWHSECQSQAGRNTAHSPFSVVLPAESEQILASSPKDISHHSTTPSSKHNANSRRYSYNPNGRPRSSQLYQPYPTNWPQMVDSRSAPHCVQDNFDTSIGPYDHRGISSHNNIVLPVCYNNGAMGLHETLATNPLMSSWNPPGTGDNLSTVEGAELND
ncbi:hypothetical protein Q7P37_004048 [Cladosporium fusiforme]